MVVSQSATHELVIITGMSGAGKTVAIRSFEDLGKEWLPKCLFALSQVDAGAVSERNRTVTCASMC